MNEKAVKKCNSCDVEMEVTRKTLLRIVGKTTEGRIPIGVGGKTVWVKGELEESGEEWISFDVYMCPKCGRIDLFADEDTKQALLTSANTSLPIRRYPYRGARFSETHPSFLKKCVKCGEQIPVASETCPVCGARQLQNSEDKEGIEHE